MSTTGIQQDFTQAIETDVMRPMQIAVVVVCFFINMADGFDIMAISFTASSIATEWQLGPGKLGMVFSAALFGMTLGAFFLSQVADVIGRRRTTLVSLVFIGMMMLLTSQVTTVEQLVWARFATGLGIGAILPGINSMVAEYAPLRLRNFSISMMHVAYPTGALVSGVAVTVLMETYGWRSVFLAGGIGQLLLVPVVWCWVPESLQYLNQKRPADALQQVNEILPKLGHEPITELPPPVQRTERAWVMGLLSDKFRVWTLLYWLAFFSVFMGLYMMWSWTPRLVEAQGHSKQAGINVGMVMNLAAVLGTPTLGWISWRLGLRRVLSVYTVVASLTIVLFAFSLHNLTWIYVLAVPLGFFMVGIPPGIYTIGARIYPTALRSTGVGVGIGVGRLGAVAGPWIAGIAMGLGWSPLVFMTLLAAIPFLVVTASVNGIRAKELDPSSASSGD
jgi:benzoate transport